MINLIAQYPFEFVILMIGAFLIHVIMTLLLNQRQEYLIRRNLKSPRIGFLSPGISERFKHFGYLLNVFNFGSTDVAFKFYTLIWRFSGLAAIACLVLFSLSNK